MEGITYFSFCTAMRADEKKSGASEWTTNQREDFANDLDHPQLLAVTDNVNQAKGDSGPEEWKPPLG